MSNSMFRQDRSIAYLDGIRGVAALGVFLNHFTLAFYPSWFTLKPETTHLDGFEMQYSHSIFSFPNNGIFCVSVFFVLSGYVLSHKYFLSDNTEVLASGLHRRFLRLFIPIAFALMVSYVLLMCNLYFNEPVAHISLSDWFVNLWHFQVDPTTRFWQSITYGTMFLGVSSYDTCLWTMPYELYGSFFVFAFLIFTHFTKRFRLLMMVLAMSYFFVMQYPIYLDFVLGMTFFYIERISKSEGKLKNILAILLLVLGCILGSLPFCSVYPDTWQETIKNTIWDYTPWCPGAAAYCLVLAFVLSPLLQKISNLRPFIFLGYISFSFYLIHPLIIGSLGSWLFLQLYNGSNYNSSVLITFITTTAFLVPASWLMAKYVDQFGIRFAKRVYEFVRRPYSKVATTSDQEMDTINKT